MSDILQEAREALEGTTPGPWEWRENHPTNACANVTAADLHGSEIATLFGCSTDDVPVPSMPDEPWGDHPVRRANARFIAWAREGVPALIARAEAAEAAERAKVAALVEALGDCVKMLEALIVESGRGIEWGHEDAFRMGEWFEAEDIAKIDRARAAITAAKGE